MRPTTLQRFGSLGKSFVSPSAAAAVLGAALLASGTTDDAETAWSPSAACLLPDVLPIAGTLLSYGGSRQLAAGGTVTHSGALTIGGNLSIGANSLVGTYSGIYNNGKWLTGSDGYGAFSISPSNASFMFSPPAAGSEVASVDYVGRFNALVGFTIGSSDSASSTVRYYRNATGPKASVRAAGGLEVKDLAGSADAALTCGAITASAAVTSPGVVLTGTAGAPDIRTVTDNVHLRLMTNGPYNLGVKITSYTFEPLDSNYGLGNANNGWAFNYIGAGSAVGMITGALDTVKIRNRLNSADGTLTCGAITASGYITSNSTAPGFELKSSGTRVGFIYYASAENRLYSDTNAPWVVESNAGFKVRNVANTADAALTCGAITASGLTSGRVPYVTTDGLITDTSSLAWDGTRLSVLSNNAGVRLISAVSNPTLDFTYLGTSYASTAFSVVAGALTQSIGTVGYGGVHLFLTDTVERLRINSTGLTVTGAITASGQVTSPLITTTTSYLAIADRSYPGWAYEGIFLRRSLVDVRAGASSVVGWTASDDSYNNAFDLVVGRDSSNTLGIYTSAARSTKAGLTCGAITASGATIVPSLLFSGTNASDYGIISSSGTRFIIGRASAAKSTISVFANDGTMTYLRGGGIYWSGSTSSSEGGGTTASVLSDSAGVVSIGDGAGGAGALTCGAVYNGSSSGAGLTFPGSEFVVQDSQGGQRMMVSGPGVWGLVNVVGSTMAYGIGDNYYTAAVKLARSGTTWVSRSDGGMQIKNLAGDADAALTCGAITASGEITSSGSGGLVLRQTSTGSAYSLTATNGGHADTYANRHTWSNSSGGTEFMRLAITTGNLLIGTTTDDGSSKLQVAGAITASGLITSDSASGGFQIVNSAMKLVRNGVSLLLENQQSGYPIDLSANGPVNVVSAQTASYLGFSAIRGDTAPGTRVYGSGGSIRVGTIADNSAGAVACGAITASGATIATGSARGPTIVEADGRVKVGTGAGNTASLNIGSYGCANVGPFESSKNNDTLVYTNAAFSLAGWAYLQLTTTNKDCVLATYTGGEAIRLVQAGGVKITGVIDIPSTTYFRGNVSQGYRFNNAANTVNLLKINDTGEVGIGLSPSRGKLHMKMTANIATGGFAIEDASNDSHLITYTDGTQWFISPTYSSTGAFRDLVLATSGTSRLTISAAGAITASGAIQETPTQSALDPTTTNIPSGKRQGWYNTTLAEFRDWVNIGGTLLKSAAYT